MISILISLFQKFNALIHFFKAIIQPILMNHIVYLKMIYVNMTLKILYHLIVEKYSYHLQESNEASDNQKLD